MLLATSFILILISVRINAFLPAIVLLVTCLTQLSLFNGAKVKFILPLCFFLAIPLAFIVNQIFYSYDFSYFITHFSFWLKDHRRELKGLSEFVGYSSCLILTIIFSNNQQNQIKHIYTQIGVVLLILGIISVYGFFDSSLITNRSNVKFWSLARRYSGVFTDPNSLGICSFLAIYILIKGNLKFILKIFGIICFVFLGVISGSRSFFLLIIVFSLFSMVRFTKLKISYLVLWILFLGVLWLLFVISFLPSQIQELNLPTTISRLMLTLHPQSFSEETNSKLIFWKIAIYVFYLSPLIGAGYNQFERFLPKANQDLNLNLQGWIDNANNFYLEVLAEQGIFGVILLAVAVSFFSIRKDVATDSLIASGAILLILFFGPHLNFAEVALLYGPILGSAFEIKHRLRFKSLFLTIMVLVFFVIALIMYNIQIKGYTFGYYQKDKGIYLRRKGNVEILCQRDYLLLNTSKNLKTITIGSSFKEKELIKDRAMPFRLDCITKSQIVPFKCSRLDFKGRPYCAIIKAIP